MKTQNIYMLLIAGIILWLVYMYFKKPAVPKSLPVYGAANASAQT